MKSSSTVLPGFRLTLAFTILYLLVIVLIPLAGLFVRSATLSADEFIAAVSAPRVMASYRVTFLAAFAAALINAVFGFLIAWVLVRYKFAGKKLCDTLIDLPFALPTAVAGIAMAALYAPDGWIGKYLAMMGLQIAFNPYGIVVVLAFVSLPFVVRTLQPVLQDLDKDIEEAALGLGATRAQTFWRVLLPHVAPAWITGVTMALARALGEYGSVIFIAGNLPMVSEIVPVIIVSKLEQYDYAGATAVALVMLLASFALLLLVNVLQGWSARRMRA
ncbi:MAG: sulfate ABC transporter permease subunit CysT [Alphaproteobacteria bacterium]|jgi:sulfate transport system permease protein|nr:sulfate ABC transporter permease subunit CysT [Thalassospira sp.]MCE2965022.1 sulfate ABC transporter permease subunit CysT [Alphaproteobacteria bacterium]